MTESEWNACIDPAQMLEFLRGKASDRKLRLFAVACCQRVEHLLSFKESREAVNAVEKHADGLMNREDLKSARNAAYSASRNARHLGDSFYGAARGVVMALDKHAFLTASCFTAFSSHCSSQFLVHELRCIFGPLPFRPVTVNPAWFTSTVAQIVAGIYEEKAFSRMPILGDALEEAGCSNADILNHCRHPAGHVRGCWVVDLILGKS